MIMLREKDKNLKNDSLGSHLNMLHSQIDFEEETSRIGKLFGAFGCKETGRDMAREA